MLIKSKAHRRYVLRVGASMAFYLITLAIAVRLLRHGSAGGVEAYVLAMLPGLAIAGVFWAVGRLIVEETDEYQRLLFVRQTLVATGFSLSVATVWGFLESFALVPHVETFYVAILWFAGLGLGALYNRLTLGDSGGGCE